MKLKTQDKSVRSSRPSHVSSRSVRNKQYQNASRYYTATGAAPKFDYYDIPEQRTRKRKAPKRKEIETNILHKITLIFALAIFFAFGVLITMSYANLKNSQEGLLRANNQLQQLQSRNETLRAEITESVDLEQVEEIAKNRLGMIEPEKYQVVNISVPRSSYTIVNSSFASSDEGDAVKDMFDLIRGAFNGTK